jgi:Zn-dependent protease with chaperone function
MYLRKKIITAISLLITLPALAQVSVLDQNFRSVYTDKILTLGVFEQQSNNKVIKAQKILDSLILVNQLKVKATIKLFTLEDDLAFAHGTDIFVQKSAVDIPQDELTFLIAHELAHIIQRHEETIYTAENKAAGPGTDELAAFEAYKASLPEIYALNRNHEFEADAMAANLTRLIGLSPDSGIRLLNRYRNKSDSIDHPSIDARIRCLSVFYYDVID